jgi:hypothetical protein
LWCGTSVASGSGVLRIRPNRHEFPGLELLDSGEIDSTLHARAILDELGARPAATLARRRLRCHRVRQFPQAAPHHPRQPGRPDRPSSRNPVLFGSVA